MREERYYTRLFVTMLIALLLVMSFSYNNYMGLLRVDESLSNLVGNQRLNCIVTFKILPNTMVRENTVEEYQAPKQTEVNVSGGCTITACEFTEEEVFMLAQCVEAEAGIGNKQSQKYVTQVILNRLHSDSFPDSLEEVIYQKNGNIPQFSVAYNGMMDREIKSETLTNVYSVLMHGTDLPEYVLYFYSDSVTNNWVNTLNVYDTVDGTVFSYAD